MVMDFAGFTNPGNYKAFKKDPEYMLVDFHLYIKSFANFLTVTDYTNTSNSKKKALLLAVGGPDMVFLFEHIGKVKVTVISVFKLFIGLAQGKMPFYTWWTPVREK